MSVFELAPVIFVDKDKCVNCHRCIATRCKNPHNGFDNSYIMWLFDYTRTAWQVTQSLVFLPDVIFADFAKNRVRLY